MANPEHLAILKQGVEAWNEWLRSTRFKAPSLFDPDLSGADLRGADLRGADLRGADLRDADLRDADLSWADLRDADLRDSDLSHASLFKAALAGAAFGATNFSDTVLSQAEGLDAVHFAFRCGLDIETVEWSALPSSFLRGCGWPERLIEYWPSISGAGIEFYSGFISYAHAEPDRAFARRLHDQLQGKGIRVWRDEHDLLPGDSIPAEIDRGIRLWDKVLLCCSKTSLKSWWVKREIEKAIEKERRLHDEHGEEILALIPLDLDGYLRSEWDDPYRSYLTQRLAADFRGWEHDSAVFETQFERVVRAMMPGGGKPPPPKPKLCVTLESGHAGEVFIEPETDPSGVIVNADVLTVDQVVKQRVLCPLCREHVFEMWPFGWDGHAAGKCSGVTGATGEERKAEFKTALRHLFRR